MLRPILGLSLTLLLGLSLSACDNPAPPAAPGNGGNLGPGTGGGIAPPPNPSPGTGGTGAGGIGGAAGSGAVGGAAGGGGAAGNGGAGGAANQGACNNVNDITALVAVIPTGNARQITATCAFSAPDCQGLQGDQEAFTECVRDCVASNVPGLSVECATCYGELGWCSGLCNVPCAQNACNEVGCEDCTQGDFDYPECFMDLNDCAGRPSRDCGPT